LVAAVVMKAKIIEEVAKGGPDEKYGVAAA
jgi:hypothetical protein